MKEISNSIKLCTFFLIFGLLEFIRGITIPYEYKYQTPIWIENNGINSTNSQVEILLDTYSLTIFEKLKKDCSDILFYDKENDKLVDFWLESGCYTVKTSFWIKLDIPYPGKTIYALYGSNTAISMSLQYWGIFVQGFSDGTCPPGWRFHSQLNSNSAFLRGSENYGGNGGSNTHTHQFTGTLSTAPNGAILDAEVYGTLICYDNHAHSCSFTTVSASNEIDFYGSVYCSVDELSTIPQNAELFFDDVNSFTKSGLSQVSSSKDKFLKGYNYVYSNTFSTSHNHLDTQNCPITPNNKNAKYYYPNSNIVASYDHQHSVTFTSTYTNHFPSYIQTIHAYNPSSNLSFYSSGSILISSELPPLGWEVESGYVGKYLYATNSLSSVGSIGGSDYHTHSISSFYINGYVGTTVSNLQIPYQTSTLTWYTTPSHVHSSLYSPYYSYSLNLPVYFNSYFIRKKSSDFTATVLQESAKLLFCNGIRNDNPNQCQTRGKCISDNLCNCTQTPYYGKDCEESIDNAVIVSISPPRINVDYKTSIASLELVPGLSGSSETDFKFNCSLIIANWKGLGESSCYWVVRNYDVETLVINLGSSYTLGSGDSLLVKSVSRNDVQVAVLKVQEYVDPAAVFFSNYWWTIIIGVSFIFVIICIIILIVVALILRTVVTQIKLSKFESLEGVDILMKEAEAQKDKSVAHFTLKKELFQIPYEELELITEIGSGGSGATVYKASWKNEIVAFKVFRTTSLGTTPDGGRCYTFEDFEREVSLLSSLHHPNILVFYGASLKPPRVGIVSEFCEGGDLVGFIGNNPSISTKWIEKLKILQGVSSAMTFLHSREIIHRDLKCENVLLTKDLVGKVIDFGASKQMETEKSNSMTKIVGTSYYIAPDVVLGRNYTSACDVFSFGIMMYVVATANFSPYTGVVDNLDQIEFKVANNPNLRPKIKGTPLDEDGKIGWYSLLMRKCWTHDFTQRPTFAEIKGTFLMELNNLNPNGGEGAINLFAPLLKNKKDMQAKVETLTKELSDLELKKKEIEENISNKSEELEKAKSKLGESSFSILRNQERGAEKKEVNEENKDTTIRAKTYTKPENKKEIVDNDPIRTSSYDNKRVSKFNPFKKLSFKKLPRPVLKKPPPPIPPKGNVIMNNINSESANSKKPPVPSKNSRKTEEM